MHNKISEVNNKVIDGSAVEKEWTERIGRHRAAVADYRQAALSLDEKVWRLPVGAEKWTPALITEHLILTYQITLQQIRGGQGIKPHYNFLLRQILRLTVLPGIFRSRRLPAGAKAPEEILPEDSNVPRETALKQLENLSVEFETEMSVNRNNQQLRLSHHVFGAIKLLEGINLAAIHIENHTRQLRQN